MEETVDGVEYRYSSDWIHHLENEEHWRSYWQQLRLILPNLKEGDSVLEIGPGSGFLSNYLRLKGFQVSTLDIDEDKNPDIVANLVLYDFPDVYDHILAFEVFEHIPYDKFEEILPKIRKAAGKSLSLSVPGNYRIWIRADLVLPLIKKVTFNIKTKRRRIIADHHFWELGYRKYSTKTLQQSIEKTGCRLIQQCSKLNLYYFHFTVSD